MAEWIKTLTELLRLNWRNAFALALTAATFIPLKRRLGFQDDTEAIVAGLGLFGFWILVALVAERAVCRVRRALRAGKIARASADKAAARAEARKINIERAIKNIAHLDDWEDRAMLWIYHKGGRARASVHRLGIGGLMTLGLIETEEARPQLADCIWVIPAEIMATIESKIGKPDRDKVKGRPPWDEE